MPNEPNEQGTVLYIRCPSCGTPNVGTSATCSRCGKPLQAKEAAPSAPARPASAAPAAQMTCPKCRKTLPAGSKFCGFCGASIPAVPPPATPRIPEPAKPAQAVTPVAAPKAPAPAPKPTATAPMPTPTPAPRPAAPKPVAPPAPPSNPTAVAQPKAARAPAAEGTQVFTGLHVPKIEASITEVKADGSAGKTVRIIKETFIGQSDCEASYPSDLLLAPRHASVRVREGKLFLKDLGSQNGTFLKQKQDAELTPGDVFLIGRTLFRFSTQRLDEVQNQASTQSTVVMSGPPKLQAGPITAKLERIQLTGEVIEEYRLDKPETTLGRTAGDLSFKDDPYMSGSHARIVARPGRFILQDLKSRNGVYRRIRNEVELRDADEFFLGEQLFRAEIKTA